LHARFYFESLDDSNQGWAGLGIGDSMSDADIVTCTWSGTSVEVNDRTSSAYGLPGVDAFQGDTESAGSFVPDASDIEQATGFGCGFIRRVNPSTPASGFNKPLWTVAPGQEEPPRTDLIVAWGSGSSTVSYHGNKRAKFRVQFASAGGDPLTPDEASAVGVVQGISRRVIPLTYIAHGFLMTVIWAVLVPVATVGLRACPGQRLWLIETHQNSMFLATSLTIPTAAAAFMAKGTWSGISLHGIIGVTISILLIAQNSLGAGAKAYFRPQQGVPQPSLAYIRWVHRALGGITVSLTTLNMCLGSAHMFPELWYVPVVIVLAIASIIAGIIFYLQYAQHEAIKLFNPNDL